MTDFDFKFTPDLLAKCIENVHSDDWFATIVNILPKYNITSVLRVSAWLAQTSHESGDFLEIKENLNYSANGLRATWPNRFPTSALANQYARQPEKIANHVYANRMGNGNETSGDGWRFRGRGLIQITGRDEYAAVSQALYGNDNLLSNPDLLCETSGAVESACWYWSSHNLNSLADKQDFITITKKINGGTIGEDDRERRYNLCLQVLRN